MAGTARVADWSGRRPAVRSLFEQRYGTGDGAHTGPTSAYRAVRGDGHRDLRLHGLVYRADKLTENRVSVVLSHIAFLRSAGLVASPLPGDS